MNDIGFPPHAFRKAGRLILMVGSAALAGACQDEPTAPADAEAISLTIVSGDGQSGVVGTELPLPLVVKATNLAGAPLKGLVVNFQVLSGGGRLYAGSGSTDAGGIAKDYWTLGTTTLEPQVVEVRAVLWNGQKRMFGQFTATALPGKAVRITIYSGDSLGATPNHYLGEAQVVLVTDQYGNPVAGTPVLYHVLAGGGSIPQGPLMTDLNGLAEINGWRLGPAPGANTLRVEAVGVGTVTFNAQALRGLATGAAHSCGLGTDGTAYCWGLNNYGQLGDGTTLNRLVPAKVSGGVRFTVLTAGDVHTCGLASDGATYCWGNNLYGQLGDGTTDTRLAPVGLLGGLRFSVVTAGGYHTCGLQGSAIYCWGWNEHGQLGAGISNIYVPSPILVIGKFSGGLDAGWRHTCAVLEDVAYCWGDNHYGQLGDGTVSSRSQPAKVVSSVGLTTISAGATHTCGTTSTAVAYCWGDNANGQLGDNSNSPRLYPVPVVGSPYYNLSAGTSFTCGLFVGTTGVCWGANANGQLGTGDVMDRWVPAVVGGGALFESIAAGGGHTCGIAPHGAAHCWGGNVNGQLGNGGTFPRLTPTEVSGGLTLFSPPMPEQSAGGGTK